MGSGGGARLSVLTLLFDPTGSGVDMFRRCLASVSAQTDVVIDWSVSVSAAAPQYEELLHAIEGDGVGTVHRQTGIAELGQHLVVALPLVGEGKAHILCHDDSYTGPGSAAEISRALDDAPALVIMPVGWDPSEAAEFADPQSDTIRMLAESRRSLRRESWGLNRSGGLSTAAWNGGSRAVRGDARYSLLADLALRRQMRVEFGGLHVLTGGLVREARWPGQSQYALAERARAEQMMWARDQGRPSAAVLGTRALTLADRVTRRLG